jgi:hypothetical protein
VKKQFSIKSRLMPSISISRPQRYEQAMPVTAAGVGGLASFTTRNQVFFPGHTLFGCISRNREIHTLAFLPNNSTAAATSPRPIFF